MDVEWKVVRDGTSLVMLQAPNGRLFRLQEFRGGSWRQTELEPIETELVAKAMTAHAADLGFK